MMYSGLLYPLRTNSMVGTAYRAPFSTTVHTAPPALSAVPVHLINPLSFFPVGYIYPVIILAIHVPPFHTWTDDFGSIWKLSKPQGSVLKETYTYTGYGVSLLM